MVWNLLVDMGLGEQLFDERDCVLDILDVIETVGNETGSETSEDCVDPCGERSDGSIACEDAPSEHETDNGDEKRTSPRDDLLDPSLCADSVVDELCDDDVEGSDAADGREISCY